MPELSEEGFSPMRMARAGRRVGKNVEIVEPASAVSPLQQEGADKHAQQQQQDFLQQLQPRPPAVQQQQAGPPAKRVGFDLQSRAPGDDDKEGSISRQPFAGVSRRKQEQLQREEIQEAKHHSKYDEKAVEGVMDIPELEEEGKEDITKIVAVAPRAPVSRVQTIVELDQDQGWLPSRKENEDIDLSLLTARLLPSEQVVEALDVWDCDLLLSQLKAELQTQEAAGDGSKDEKEELRQI